jgi:hypothetical protein
MPVSLNMAMSEKEQPESQRETGTELQEGALTGSGGQRGLDTVPGASTPPPTTPETIDLLLSSTSETDVSTK